MMINPFSNPQRVFFLPHRRGDTEAHFPGLRASAAKKTAAAPYLLSLGCLFALFFACTGGKRDIRAYYFPVDDLRDGKVYAYTALEGDTTDRRYCYYRTILPDSGQFLVSTQYDRYFGIVQILREKIVDNGSLARQTTLYETDTASVQSHPVEAAIESPNLFPFRVTDSLGVFLFGLRYHPSDDTAATIYLIRNRRYLGDGPEFAFGGEKYATVRFGLREVIGHSKEGSSEFEGTGEEWYAKGLGLVYFSKSFSEGNIRYAFRLSEIFPMAELERRARQ